ncbi:ribosomal RNA-processing protein 7 homolog a [Phtheirospermum japonicum]|uniref:Ribosomal RNA-processing protein 7 homolog a n=1 Tax=Phtheirospermum japonicum TaxID=374723 RepID=A0A830DF54_9LAMI|nr:ribosomal RNA-processing protein 7 homolog a [Phtheirospermum japonicum]
MGAEDSIKKLKRKKNTSQIVSPAQKDGKLANKKMKKKKSSVDVGDKVEMFGLPNIQDETHKTSGGNRKSKKLRNNKTKNGKKIRARVEDFDTPQSDEVEDGVSGEKHVDSELSGEKLQKARRKKRKNTERINEKDDASEQQNVSKPEDTISNSEELNKTETRRISKTGKSKKPGKTKKKSRSVKNEANPDKFLESRGDDTQDEVYQMSSGDEDCSKGMKKWITQYYQSRPGLELLQERIDDFIMDHEAKEEQFVVLANKQELREKAQAAEGGWTVVVQHRGRKKTTDAESGVAVGSVAKLLF